MRKILTKLTLILVFCIGVSAFSKLQSQVIVAKWDFEDDAKKNPIAQNDHDAFVTYSYTADDGIAENKDIATISLGGSATFNAWYGGVTGEAVTAKDWNMTDGFWQISIVTTGYKNLTLSSRQRGSNTGPKEFQIQFSTNNGETWTDVGTAITVTADFSTGGKVENLDLTSACDNQAQLLIRWKNTSNVAVNNSTVTATGNNRIDDIVVMGVLDDPCLATVPFFEGFEDGFTDATNVGGCWTQERVGTKIKDWKANSSQTGRNRTPRNGDFNATLAWNGEAWLFHKVYLEFGESYDLSVWARQDDTVPSLANLTLAWGTEANATAMTPNIFVDEQPISDGDYQEVKGTFSVTTTGTYYIGIKGYADNGIWYLSIDDILLEKTPTCYKPTALQVQASSITAHSAEISWTAASENPGVPYHVYSSTDATPPADNISSGYSDVTGVSTTLSGLSSSTKYYVWVRSNCPGDDYSAWAGPVSFETIPTCFVPTGLETSNITANSAEISWTAAIEHSDVPYHVYSSTDATPPEDDISSGYSDVTDASTTLSGLFANTKYYVWVRSNCGLDDYSAWAGPISFTTTQVPATLPYIDDFATNQFTFVNGTYINQWAYGSATGNEANAIYISNDGGTTNAYTTSNSSEIVVQAYRDIAIDSDVSIVNFSFDWKCVGETGTWGTPPSKYDYFRVWLVPTTYMPTAGTQIETGPNRIQIGESFNGQADWVKYTNSVLDLSSFAGSTMRLVFEWKNDFSGGTQPPAAIDNLSITIPSCIPPINLQASLVGANAAELTWAAPGSTPDGYQVYYNTTGEIPNESTEPQVNNIDGTSISYATDPILDANTTYYVWLRTDCGSENYSDWAGPVEVTTPYYVPAPWSEGFATVALPDGWTKSSYMSIGSNINQINTGGASGNYIYQNLYGTSSYSTGNFLTVAIGPITGTEDLSFDYKLVNYSGNSGVFDPPAIGSGNFVLEISIDFGNTWTTIETVDNNGVEGWQNKVYSLSAYGADAYVQFRITANRTGGDYYIAFDNFNLATCLPVSGLNHENITAHTATINWTASSSTTDYHVYISQTDVAPTSEATYQSVIDATSIGLTDLDADTEYYVWVRSDCGSDDYSTWVGPHNFATIPSCFEPTNIQESSITANSATISWDASTENPADASYHVYLSQTDVAPTSEATYQSVIDATSINLIDLDADTEYYVWVRSDCGSDDYSVWVGPHNFATIPSCFVPVNIIANDITANSATISWGASADNPDDATYHVYYSKTDVAPTDDIEQEEYIEAPNNSIALPNLDHSSTYYVWVRSNCGTNDYSAWAGYTQFNTECVAATVPFFEGFEEGYTHGESVGRCWTQESVSGYDEWVINSTEIQYNRTPRTGSFNATLRYDNTGWLFYEVYLEADVSYDLSVWARQDETSGVTLTLAWGTEANSAAMTNIVVDAQAITNGNYQEVKGTFNVTATGNYYIGIKGHLDFNPAWHLSIDDILLRETPTCFEPTNIVASDITTNSATISWTASTVNPEATYHVYYSKTPTAPADDIEQDQYEAVGINSILLENLDHSSTYYVWVRSVCTGDDYGYWTEPGIFETSCVIISEYPYFEGFNSSTIPNCWTIIDNEANNQTWYPTTSVSSVTPYECDYMMASKFHTSFQNDDWLISPQFKVTSNKLKVDFYAISTTSFSSYESFNVLVSKAGTAPTDFDIVLENIVDHPNTWENHEYILSEHGINVDDEIYIAIQHVSNNKWYLAVDAFRVSEIISTEAEITAYSIPEQVSSNINSTEGTITVTMPYGTNVTELVATFTLSEGASAKVGETEQISTVTTNNFETPVTYTVTAEDGIAYKEWTVTVTVELNSEAEIITYTLPGQIDSEIISSETAGTINVTMNYGIDLANDLIAEFTLSEGASAKVGTEDQESTVTPNNFATPVVYTVTAEDGTTKEWTVNVTVSPTASSEAEILTYSIPDQVSSNINSTEGTITVTMPYQADVTELVADFTLSYGASAKVGETDQESGNTTNNFTDPVVYVVTAQDGTIKNWTVTVIAPNTAAEITAYSIPEQVGNTDINPTEQTITVTMPYDTDVTELVAEFTLSEGASAKVDDTDQVSGDTPNNFTESVVYIVTAEDGTTTKNWTVTVNFAPNTAAAIETYSFEEQHSPAVIDNDNHKVTIEVNAGTNLNGLVATFTLSDGASAKVGETDQVSGDTPNNFTDTVTYTVTAEAGNTQDWIVIVSVAVGIEDVENSALTIYPNPNNGNFTLDFTNINGKVNYQIFDTKGSIIISDDFVANGNAIKEVSLNLVPGVYFVKLVTETQSLVEKLVVE